MNEISQLKVAVHLTAAVRIGLNCHKLAKASRHQSHLFIFRHQHQTNNDAETPKISPINWPILPLVFAHTVLLCKARRIAKKKIKLENNVTDGRSVGLGLKPPKKNIFHFTLLLRKRRKLLPQLLVFRH